MAFHAILECFSIEGNKLARSKKAILLWQDKYLRLEAQGKEKGVLQGVSQNKSLNLSEEQKQLLCGDMPRFYWKESGGRAEGKVSDFGSTPKLDYTDRIDEAEFYLDLTKWFEGPTEDEASDKFHLWEEHHNIMRKHNRLTQEKMQTEEFNTWIEEEKTALDKDQKLNEYITEAKVNKIYPSQGYSNVFLGYLNSWQERGFSQI